MSVILLVGGFFLVAIAVGIWEETRLGIDAPALAEYRGCSQLAEHALERSRLDPFDIDLAEADGVFMAHDGAREVECRGWATSVDGTSESIEMAARERDGKVDFRYTLNAESGPTPALSPSVWDYDDWTAPGGTRTQSLDAFGEWVPPRETGTLSSSPYLGLVCYDESDFLPIISWGWEDVWSNPGTNVIATMFKVDDDGLILTESDLTDDNQAIYIRDKWQFLEDIREGQQLLVRVESYPDNVYTARFQLTGLDEELGKLPCVSP